LFLGADNRAYVIDWDACKLAGYKAERLENNPAFQLPSRPASTLLAVSYLSDT
jgi:hypothetical protein